ncbi:hypothetical protein IMZ48_37275 [Candidatus Bathyarchaeota archaeon]|nr:hypothetical protein [Candidatus Bathyarchaeota archaeon]
MYQPNNFGVPPPRHFVAIVIHPPVRGQHSAVSVEERVAACLGLFEERVSKQRVDARPPHNILGDNSTSRTNAVFMQQMTPLPLGGSRPIAASLSLGHSIGNWDRPRSAEC